MALTVKIGNPVEEFIRARKYSYICGRLVSLAAAAAQTDLEGDLEAKGFTLENLILDATEEVRRVRTEVKSKAISEGKQRAAEKKKMAKIKAGTSVSLETEDVGEAEED